MTSKAKSEARATSSRPPTITRPGPLTRRVAREARRLALECAAGEAPPLILMNFKDSTGDSCALGWVLRRTGGRDVDPWERFHEFADELYRRVHDKETQLRQHDAWLLVIQANNHTPIQHRAGAVVFPLLSLADALVDRKGDATKSPSVESEPAK